MTVSLAKPARLAVQLGIEFLDANVPNWREQIDLDRLDLGSCQTCVLGQLFADYDEEQYGQANDWMNPSGFQRGSWVLHDWIETHVDPDYDTGMVDIASIYGFDSQEFVNYTQLEAEWRKVLAS